MVDRRDCAAKELLSYVEAAHCSGYLTKEQASTLSTPIRLVLSGALPSLTVRDVAEQLEHLLPYDAEVPAIPERMRRSLTTIEAYRGRVRRVIVAFVNDNLTQLDALREFLLVRASVGEEEPTS